MTDGGPRERPREPLRIAVLGAGLRAQSHMAAIAVLRDHWRLVAVCDVLPERAEAAGGRYDVPAFTDPLTLLERARPDAVFVIVPPEGHHPLALAAAERGIHVITEVPISITLPLADLMLETAARHRVVLEVAENTWRGPRERLRQEVVRRGLIGPPTVVRLTYTSGSYHGIGAVRAILGGMPASVSGWRHFIPVTPYADLSGAEQLTHDWEFGLYRWPAAGGDGHPGATLLYEQPPRPGGRNGWEVVGPRGRLAGEELYLFDSAGGRPAERRYAMAQEMAEVDGVPALARVSFPTDPPVVWENPLLRRGIPAGADLPGHALADLSQLVTFHDSIVDGKPSVYGVEGRRDLECLIALRDSARRGGAPVALPLTEVTQRERELHDLYARTHGHSPVDGWREALTSLYPRAGITRAVP
jgi:predicted dehydrogenase